MKINEVVLDWNEFSKKENFQTLEVEKIIFELPKGIIHKCIGCGNCCITNETPLTLTDKKIIRQFLSNNDNKDLNKLKNRFFRFKGKSPDSTSGYYLTKIPLTKPRIFKNRIYNSKCIFLSQNNKCLIQSVKPNICKKYPFELLPKLNLLNPETLYCGFGFEGADLSNCPKGTKLIMGIIGTEATSDYTCNGFFKAESKEQIQDIETLKIVAKAIRELMDDIFKQMDLNETGD